MLAGRLRVAEVRARGGPSRFPRAWRDRRFAPGEQTAVEIRFEPAIGGITVVLEHRGFAGLPTGHVVRQGLDGDAFEALIGYYWAELLTTFRARCSGLLDASDATSPR